MSATPTARVNGAAVGRRSSGAAEPSPCAATMAVPAAAGQKRGLKRALSKELTQGIEEAARPLFPTSGRARKSVGCDTSCTTQSASDTLHPSLRNLKSIIINLDRRPDRMQGCTRRLETYCPWLRHERFSATDGKQTPIPLEEAVMSWDTKRNVVYQKLRAIRKGWNDLDTYQERQLVLSPGERGCASSHIRAWRYCLEQAGDSNRPLLVLEDDAAPVENFTAILNRAMAALPSDAHVLYLGYSQAAEWRRQVSPELAESEYVWTTVGYIVWPEGARIMLNHLPVDQPVDNWMACLCADLSLKAYCTTPKIIRQAEAWNVNSDVAHSDEHYWGPNSDIHHSDAFYWGPSAETDSTGGAVGDARFTGSLLWDVDSDDSQEDSSEEA